MPSRFAGNLLEWPAVIPSSFGYTSLSSLSLSEKPLRFGDTRKHKGYFSGPRRQRSVENAANQPRLPTVLAQVAQWRFRYPPGYARQYWNNWLLGSPSQEFCLRSAENPICWASQSRKKQFSYRTIDSPPGQQISLPYDRQATQTLPHQGSRFRYRTIDSPPGQILIGVFYEWRSAQKPQVFPINLRKALKSFSFVSSCPGGRLPKTPEKLVSAHNESYHNVA